MVDLYDVLLILSETAIVFLGGILVYVSLRAYRRHGSRSMLVMSLAFVLILLGSIIEEITLEFLGYHMIESHILENTIVALGLLILVYSIYGVRG